jgi:hypothetical protein
MPSAPVIGKNQEFNTPKIKRINNNQNPEHPTSPLLSDSLNHEPSKVEGRIFIKI